MRCCAQRCLLDRRPSELPLWHQPSAPSSVRMCRAPKAPTVRRKHKFSVTTRRSTELRRPGREILWALPHEFEPRFENRSNFGVIVACAKSGEGFCGKGGGRISRGGALWRRLVTHLVRMLGGRAGSSAGSQSSQRPYSSRHHHSIVFLFARSFDSYPFRAT